MGIKLNEEKFFARHRKLIIILSIIIILVIGIVLFINFRKKSIMGKNITANMSTEYATAKSGDISLTVTGSGAIESSNVKNINSEVSAKLKQVNVSVGDKVKAGDVLFVLDSSELDSKIREKQKQITNYQKSIDNYQKSITEYEEDKTNLNVYSDESGYVQNLKITKGDSVNKNDVIFELVDNSNYEATINVYYFANNPVNVGDKVKMMLSDSYSYIDGEVISVSDLKEQSSSGGQSQKVVVSIKNPGYTLEGINIRDVEIITQNGTKVSAVKNEQVTIKMKDAIKYRSPSSGKVIDLLISDGSYVEKGMLIINLENDDYNDKINSTNDSISDVRTSISDTSQDINDLKDDYSFYTITSPIDGVVTSISVSEGDYVRSESTIAKIINTEQLQFEISVDELDILKLKVGQEAKISIDAIESTEKNPIIGYVSEIGLEGTNSNNVTSYPVTIILDGREDIKMGMNCSVEIVVQSSKNVLTIPVEAVNSRRDKYTVTMEDGSTREVQIGIYDEENIAIVSGLTIGERVKLPTKVTSNNTTQNDNQNVGGFNIMGGGNMPGGMPNGGGNISNTARTNSNNRSNNGGNSNRNR